MQPKAGFVDGGGWVTRQTFGRPKTRFFVLLSVAWSVVCVLGGALVWNDWAHLPAFHRWACVLVLAIAPLLLILSIAFRLTEKPRTWIEHRTNPDYDVHNLY